MIVGIHQTYIALVLEQSAVKRLDLVTVIIFDKIILELISSETSNRQTHKASPVYVVFVKTEVDPAPSVLELVDYSNEQAVAIDVFQRTEDFAIAEAQHVDFVTQLEDDI